MSSLTFISAGMGSSQGSAFPYHLLPLYVTCTTPTPWDVQDRTGLCPAQWRRCGMVNTESVSWDRRGHASLG